METDKKDKLLKVAKKIQTWIHAHPRKATIVWDVIHEFDDAIASLESELAEQKPIDDKMMIGFDVLNPPDKDPLRKLLDQAQEFLTKAKLIEILGKYSEYDLDIGYFYIDQEYCNYIASEIFALHDAEIAKYKELVEAYKKLDDLQTISSTTDFDVHNKLRRRISELESEVGK